MDIEYLKHKYLLSNERFDRIFQLVIHRLTYGITPVEHPKAIILGAQPGAGKTELQKEAEFRMLQNVVICNADTLRDFHPQAETIKKEYPWAYPEITVEYAQRWNDDLCRYCETNRLNYILETTFSSGSRLNDTIKRIKEKGYKVDIMLLAVSARLSLLGTHLRYEDSVSKTGAGRRVLKHDHDSRFKAIPDTIKQIEEAGLYDNFYLYARSVVLEHSQLIDGVTLIAHNPDNLMKAYKEELARKFPARTLKYFYEKCNYVLECMKKRGANKMEISTFKKNMGISLLRPPYKNRGLGK